VSSTEDSIIGQSESTASTVVRLEPSPTTLASTDQPSNNDQLISTPLSEKNCLLAGGEVELFEIPGEEDLSGRIYTPPCYLNAGDRRYPVLYILHGDTETDQQWDDLGLDEWADTLIVEGEIPPLIIVMPRENTWVDLPENPFGDQLVKTIIPWIDSQYRTLPDRQFRAIGGLSRGGNWAVRVGLLQWGLFGSIGAHSSPLFFGDLNRVAGWVEIIPDSLFPRILIDIGEGDNNLAESNQFHELLIDLKVPHDRQLNPGLHNDDYWRSQIEYYLRWYSSAWEIE
jgi:enterochelin esterase-like enzyme